MNQDFNLYIRTLAASLAEGSIDSGFSYESEPIFAPIVAFPPSLLVDRNKAVNPFRNHHSEKKSLLLSSWFEKVKDHKNLALPKGESFPGFLYIAKMWSWVLLYVTSPLYYAVMRFAKYLLRRKDILINDPGSDSDYVDDDSSESDDSDTCSSVASDEIYKEIFMLAQESYQNESLGNENFLNMEIFDQSGIRTRKQRLMNNDVRQRSSSLISPQINQTKSSSSVQSSNPASFDCVICQTNPRTIGTLFFTSSIKTLWLLMHLR